MYDFPNILALPHCSNGNPAACALSALEQLPPYVTHSGRRCVPVCNSSVSHLHPERRCIIDSVVCDCCSRRFSVYLSVKIIESLKTFTSLWKKIKDRCVRTVPRCSSVCLYVLHVQYYLARHWNNSTFWEISAFANKEIKYTVEPEQSWEGLLSSVAQTYSPTNVDVDFVRWPFDCRMR